MVQMHRKLKSTFGRNILEVDFFSIRYFCPLDIEKERPILIVMYYIKNMRLYITHHSFIMIYFIMKNKPIMDPL